LPVIYVVGPLNEGVEHQPHLSWGPYGRHRELYCILILTWTNGRTLEPSVADYWLYCTNRRLLSRVLA
jgi:hypothetical protein